MVVAQRLRPDHVMQVRLHVLLHDVHLSEGFEIAGFLDIEDADDVVVFEVFEQFDFSQRAKTKELSFERLNLLDCNRGARSSVDAQRDHSVRSLAQNVFHLVVSQVENKLFGVHGWKDLAASTSIYKLDSETLGTNWSRKAVSFIFCISGPN
ncbi:hypothetical protein OGATHE_000231 [Ogataea polymorpha]|uniref:Uncharacterized protein n=1 Tax=Ogataea polymorpha TaxID=460523 RepID=A0A9P8THK6_9ASCO|nr:hypothetical protein OGATHE_000231 [Ogataea polymorpha]